MTKSQLFWYRIANEWNVLGQGIREANSVFDFERKLDFHHKDIKLMHSSPYFVNKMSLYRRYQVQVEL